MDYQQYLLSTKWKKKADAAKEWAGHRCQVCNSPESIAAHHRTYERLGNELPQDITVLCAKCHEIFHTESDLYENRLTITKRPWWEYLAPKPEQE